MLAELVQCPCIRLLASMDHVNAPLLWDRRTAARFNWSYFDATTYAPYHAEAQEMPSLLIGRRSALMVSKAHPSVSVNPAAMRPTMRMLRRRPPNSSAEQAPSLLASRQGHEQLSIGLTFVVALQGGRVEQQCSSGAADTGAPGPGDPHAAGG